MTTTWNLDLLQSW